MKVPFLRQHFRLLVALTTFLVAMCVATSAHAQFTITVATEASLPRLDSSGNPTDKRDRNLEPEAVSQQDCFADQRIRFALILTGLEGNATLEAWAGLLGADCKQPIQRTGASAVCWQLTSGIPLAQNVNVDLPVRKIMSGANNNAQKPDTTEAICGKVDLTTINVSFLYFPPGAGNGVPTVEKILPIKVDTVGPLPPSGLRTKPGNTRIQVEWNNISGDAGGISVLTGIKVYCDPAGSASSSSDGGGTQRVCTNVPIDAGPDAADGGDAGTVEECVDVPVEAGATSTTPGSATAACTSENLAPSGGAAIVPSRDFNTKYECGSITGNTGTTARAEQLGGNPLQNNVQYAVAVAATDAFGNVGPLSDLLCETPEETSDFWEDYRKAGGGAGGGYCATPAPGLPLGSLSAIGIVLVTSLSFLRRRLNKRSENDKRPRR